MTTTCGRRATRASLRNRFRRSFPTATRSYPSRALTRWSFNRPRGGTYITTVVTTYQTTNGTSPGGTTNQGENGDGTGGSGTGGTGGSDDEEGNASRGGGSCESPPASSGDPILAQMATQTWATRCEAEKANKVTVSGTLTNCAQAYSVQGGHPNARKLCAMRKQVCSLEGEGNVDASSYLGDGTDNPDPASLVTEGSDATPDGFDQSGFGWGATCPAIPTINVFGQSITVDTNGIFGDWMHLGGWFVLVVAGMACVRVLLAA